MEIFISLKLPNISLVCEKTWSEYEIEFTDSRAHACFLVILGQWVQSTACIRVDASVGLCLPLDLTAVLVDALQVGWIIFISDVGRACNSRFSGEWSLQGWMVNLCAYLKWFCFLGLILLLKFVECDSSPLENQILVCLTIRGVRLPDFQYQRKIHVWRLRLRSLFWSSLASLWSLFGRVLCSLRYEVECLLR